MHKAGLFIAATGFLLHIYPHSAYSQINQQYFNCTADASNMVALIKTVNHNHKKPNLKLLSNVQKLEQSFIKFVIFSAKKDKALLTKYKKNLLTTLQKKSAETKKKMGQPNGLNEVFKSTFTSVQSCALKYLPVMKKSYKQAADTQKKKK
ncbi:MAG: hypothetical protein ACRBBN_06430 [Methyloligellaceae bacterium]